MKWVAWENIGVDRMACIWLIRRWIDANAEFLFVPAGAKPLPKGAEPFDIPGARYSHHRGPRSTAERRKRCDTRTFNEK